MSAAGTSLVTVPFYGDQLQATREGDKVWVVLKRVCEALGIDFHSQRKKLAEKPWASVEALITSTGNDGKSYETLCLDVECVPMWLATIDVGRVSIGAREKLAAYQCECARVLKEHFFGRPAAPSAPAPGLTADDVQAIVSGTIRELTPALLSFAAEMMREARPRRRSRAPATTAPSSDSASTASAQSPAPSPAPAPVPAQTELALGHEDNAAHFVAQFCVIEPSARAVRSELRGAYLRWCAREQLQPFSAQHFSGRVRDAVRAIGFHEAHVNVQVGRKVRDGWRGIRLRSALASN